MYKFQRINEGPLRGCYHHPYFERDRFDLIDKINRKDRGDEEDSACCESSCIAAKAKNNRGVSLSSIVETSCRKDTFLHTDSDTAASHNDFESIDFSLNETPIVNDMRLGKGDIRRNANERKKFLVPESSRKISSHTHALPSRAETYFDSIRKIANEAGFFDLDDDSTMQFTSITRPETINVDVLSHVSDMLPRPLESSPPFLLNVPRDILDEIIRTFKSTQPDTQSV